MISTKIYDKYKAKLAEKGRTDIYLADWQRLGKTTANVLFGFNKEFGLLKSEDIVKHVLSSFEGKLEVDETSVKIYPEGAISVVASLKKEKKALEESKSLKCVVAETMYIDEKLKDIWEVQKNEEGSFLARVQKEDIASILAERKKKMFATASLNFSVVTAGTYGAEAGDKVKFYFDSKQHCGTVKSIDESGVYKIKCDESGKDFCVSKEAILRIVEVAPKTKESIKKELQDYYSKMLGKELGKEIVKE